MKKLEISSTQSILLASALGVAVLLSGCSSSGGDGSTSVALSTNTLADVKTRQLAMIEKAKADQAERMSKFEAARTNALKKKSPDGKSYALRVKSPAAISKPGKKKIVKKASISSASRVVGNIKVNAPWKCVPSNLKSMVRAVSKRFGPVVVNSTYRSRSRNRRVGGAKSSYHLRCQAVDFRVLRGSRGVYSFLARHRSVGGLKRYRSGFFHIDTGPRRTW